MGVWRKWGDLEVSSLKHEQESTSKCEPEVPRSLEALRSSSDLLKNQFEL
jgi:hypothetical protein